MYRGRASAAGSVVMALIVSSAVACSDPSGTTGPLPSASAGVNASGNARLVNMMDACDGPSFNAVLGPGECIRNGGVSFDNFIGQLTRNQSAGAWHNAPSMMDAKMGDMLLAVNKGGETHTFTHVAHFGGGIVPSLNALAGTPVPAPECLAETNFVPPGGTDTEALAQNGTEYFQCCIHPWMRTTVRVSGS
jgi:hypothetical protein